MRNILFGFSFLLSTVVIAQEPNATRTSIANGNATNPFTWDCTCLPTPGDNVIIRKRGFRKLKRTDRGQPWKQYLNVQPLGTPKDI